MNVSKNFSTYCDMAGIPSNEVEEFWINAQEDTTTNFLTWIIKEAELKKEQLLKIEEVFNDIKQGKSENLVSGILELLDEEQQKQAINKFAEIFLDNLEQAYDQIGQKMTIDQKQVVNAYIQKVYV